MSEDNGFGYILESAKEVVICINSLTKILEVIHDLEHLIKTIEGASADAINRPLRDILYSFVLSIREQLVKATTRLSDELGLSELVQRLFDLSKGEDDGSSV